MTGECLWTGRPGTLSRYTGTYYSYRPACHTASLIPEKIERVLVTVSPPGHERHFDELEVVKGGYSGVTSGHYHDPSDTRASARRQRRSIRKVPHDTPPPQSCLMHTSRWPRLVAVGNVQDRGAAAVQAIINYAMTVTWLAGQVLCCASSTCSPPAPLIPAEGIVRCVQRLDFRLLK
jgi:hypothetical protein